MSNLAKDNANVSDIYLHVQVSNEAAIGFYKKNGFEEIGTLRYLGLYFSNNILCLL